MPGRLTSPEELRELLGIPFTAEQLRAITAPLAPAVIVAGAGSGKTTVMAARVVWLVGTGQVRPEQVLGLTFTNKAAAELAERVRKALLHAGVVETERVEPSAQAGGDEFGEPEISTYHAFAGRLLTDHGLRIGLEPDVRLLADATRFQLAARVLRQAPGPYPGLKDGVSSLIAKLVKLDGELAEHLVPPERLITHDTELLASLAGVKLGNESLRAVPVAAEARRELAELVVRYRARKREAQLMDFGDQIAACARLALTRPEVGGLLREQFAVVLLDEYQDTSVAQRLMLASLFGDGTGHPVTAVGDPCQAIYGWRGASVANLDEFPHHFREADSDRSREADRDRSREADRDRSREADPTYRREADAARSLGAEPPVAAHDVGVADADARADDAAPRGVQGAPAARYSLSENRRSGGRLLAFANDLAAPLRAMHEGVAALRPAPGEEQAGGLRCALLETHEAEVAWVADSIAHLVRTGTAPGRIAVLCRAGRELFPDVHAALVARDVPVEVVGLSGLLHLPEIADLVATCEVLQDPTANAALVRLLSGPRWRIGPRDLALLGRRARDLVRVAGDDGRQDKLEQAVAEADPTEIVSLADALESFLYPGQAGEPELPFSADAAARFQRLAVEIRELRRALAEPLMDVLHRVLTVTGLEVELAASPHALAARRRETLSAFLDVAAGFADLDGDPSLGAFLAFLRTAQEYDRGLDNNLPSGEDTVKVLTAHKSKGLEWDVVFVPGLVKGAFPSGTGRERWTSRPEVLPHTLRGDAASLPADPAWTSAGLKEFEAEMKTHAATEELRLGYVAFTRPRALLYASGHWWGPSQKRPRGPSPFLDALRIFGEEQPGSGVEIEHWAEPPAEDAQNPALDQTVEHAWPLPLDAAAQAARRAAGTRVLAGSRGEASPEPEPEAAEERRLVASWDRDLELLSAELRRSRSRVREVALPASLSASQLLRVAADPDGFARELARPVPRPPQPAARRGTRFHAWVESRLAVEPLLLLGEEELPGLDDSGIEDERDLARLKEAFLRTEYAARTPYRIEEPFQLVLGGRVVRGRIDAVYRTPQGFEVVDWKTNHRETADPLQLAVYRLAWAEREGLDPALVSAAFLYVRSGTVVRPQALPGREGLEALLDAVAPNGERIGEAATEAL
ncbi:ATP-dependent DNA helicase [Streptacidiphilus jiangxiensis]|uniref:DNA 3'-5' helicase n=1 Tax=Streptacidiphilus jiangxiensis TaxID=235985 RepID=A0A1H7FZH4_STRJI|nr:ATP-dependent DNA helicase [Streptacidiphilus jiangxiensis]SEK29912.1 PD-(D/E)XK nuclease superfamily protein [Streptacidiphilus jiangxiensis]